MHSFVTSKNVTYPCFLAHPVDNSSMQCWWTILTVNVRV